MRVIRMNQVYGIEIGQKLSIMSMRALKRMLKKELKLETNVADKILRDGGVI